MPKQRREYSSRDASSTNATSTKYLATTRTTGFARRRPLRSSESFSMMSSMTVIPQPLYSTDRLRLTDSDAHVAGSPNRAGHSSQSQRYIFQIRDAVCIRPNLARSRPSLLYTTLSESPPRHTSPITSPFVIPSTHERLPHAARVTELATWRRGRHTPCGSRRARFLSHGDSRRPAGGVPPSGPLREFHEPRCYYILQLYSHSTQLPTSTGDILISACDGMGSGMGRPRGFSREESAETQDDMLRPRRATRHETPRT